MKTNLSLLAGLLILLSILACSSSEEGNSPAAAQVAEMSQFPTPTRSLAEPPPTSQPAIAQVQTSQNAGDADGEEAPLSEAELQQLRQRLQSGELTEEEARQAFQRLRAQFGDGPGGPGGSQVAGSIEGIEESTFTVTTEVASVSVSVGADTIIRVTSVLEPTAMSDGSQVMVVSERLEGKTLARVITIIPEGQAPFGRGQGAFGGGQARAGGAAGNSGGNQGATGANQARPGGRGGIFGTIADVNDSGFTLETQQGPLPIVTDEESVILKTGEGVFADLEVGMQVRVTGPASEDGMIEARTVIVTPEELEDLRRPATGL